MLINIKYKKKRGKYKKKLSNSSTPVTTGIEMDFSVTNLDEETNNLQNNTEKHVLNETELLDDEEQIHHKPKRAKKNYTKSQYKYL